MEDEKPIVDSENGDPETEAHQSSQSHPFRTVSRINYVVLTVVMFILLLLCLISIGSLGKKQGELERFHNGNGGCILTPTRGTFLGQNVIRFSRNYGACGFVFWGWSSISIVAIFFMVYLIIHTILGSNLFSLWRIVDISVSIPTCFFSFIFSIIVTVGRNQTCSVLHSLNDFIRQLPCSNIVLTHVPDDGITLPFYKEYSTAVESSWVATFLLGGYAAWNFGLLVYYIIRRPKNQTRSGPI